MLPRIFIGRMSNGRVTARLSKPGFSAKDPNTLVANLMWSSDLPTFQLISSGVDTIPVTRNTASAVQKWTNVTCSTIVGTPLLLSVWTCSQYAFWNYATPISLITSPRFSTGTWFVGGATRVQDVSSTDAVTFNAGLGQKVRNATTLAFTHNNTYPVTVRWQLYDAR